MSKKRIIFILSFLAFALVFSSVFIYKKRKKQEKIRKKQEQEATLLIQESAQENVLASGKIQAEKQVKLKFQTSGKLAWVGVKEGDRVKKWQAIAKLDTYQIEQNIKDKLLTYSKERNDFEEGYRVTYKEQTPSTALTNTIKRILEKNQWDLEKAVIDVELKNYALKLATLITPIKGIVTKIDTPYAGINITPASAVFTIADPSSVEFVADVDEIDIVKLKKGQKAIITLDSQPNNPIKSEIKRISFNSIKVSGGGTAYQVFLKLPKNNNLIFRLGMNGEAEFKN